MIGIKLLVAGLCLSVWVCGTASAATALIGIDPRNTIPGRIATGIVADGEGIDWTGAVLLINLTSGSIYNAPAFDGATQQSAFWGLVPSLQWDSYVGIAGDPTGGIAGGAGDLGGPGGANQLGLLASDAQPQLVSVTWFNTRTTDTGPTLIGNITTSVDAAGTWQMIVSFADGTLIQQGGQMVGGTIALGILPPPWPEPGTLSLLGIGAIGLLRRSRGGA